MSCKASREQLEQFFKSIDKNNSGFIDKIELENILKKSCHTTEQVNEFLKYVDTDSDGKLNIQEFLRIFSKK